MDFLDLASKTRSCRRFKEAEGLPAGTLEWLVSCARVAPCGGNKQALRFATVASPAVCAALFPALKWAGYLPEWGGPEAGERPSGYIVIMADAGKRDHIVSIDMGIAAQTIQLAACSKGIGDCIFMSFDPHKVRELLEIPAALDPVLVLALGVAKEERRLVPVPADGSIKYWRDENGVHYVPKRSLEELLLIRK
ncbi:MAG: nitroreductase family protein [Bilophila sp.]